MKRYILTIFISAFACILHAQNKHALLIGISDYTPAEKESAETWDNIHGANDVRLLAPVLVEQGFLVDSLTNEKASASNIRKHLSKLVSRASMGDIVLIHFSGHGQPVEDALSNDKDESDGIDESIVPVDALMTYKKGVYEGKNHILDDELNNVFSLLRTKVGKNGFIYVLIDACHAGTMYRGLSDTVYIRGTKEVFGPQKLYFKQPAKKNRSSQYFKLPRNSTMSHIYVLEACRADEFNREIRRRGNYYGPLSFYFYKALQNYTLGHDTVWVQSMRKNFDEDSALSGEQNIVVESSIK